MPELINWFRADWRSQTRSKVKFFAQPHTTLCIQFLDRENNNTNNTLPLGKQTCLTIVWGCAETLPRSNCVCELIQLCKKMNVHATSYRHRLYVYIMLQMLHEKRYVCMYLITYIPTWKVVQNELKLLNCDQSLTKRCQNARTTRHP